MVAFTFAGVMLLLFFVFVLYLCTRDRERYLDRRDNWEHLDLNKKSRMGRWSY
ncbi:MAG: hypothetical protein ABSC71_15840 [Candidatus Acidiferrales bacterium]|jgi:hypothetical protein